MSKSGSRNPPTHSRFKKGVSGNRKGRPKREALVLGDIISKAQNTLTEYREGGRTKWASRLELGLKKLVNSALEGDARSAEELLKLLAKASKNSDARSQTIIVEDWVPDFEGQTGEQKTRAHARENEIDLTDPGEQASSSATDPPGSPSSSPNASRDE